MIFVFHDAKMFKKSQIKNYYWIFLIIIVVVFFTSSTILIAQVGKEDKKETPDYIYKIDNEEINVSYYVLVDGEKIKVAYESFLNKSNKFGFTFNESKINKEVKDKKNKSFDKKIYIEIEGMGGYEQTGQYSLEKSLPTPSNTLGLENRDLLDFSDIFNKETNLYNFTIEEINQSVCIDENCTNSTIVPINIIVKHKREFNYSFNKIQDKWIIEFYNLFELDPIFLDNLQSDFSLGTLFQTNVTPSVNGGANVTLNYTIITNSGCSECGNMSSGQLRYNNTGNFTSQVFDTLGETSVFDKIMWGSRFQNTSNFIGAACHNTANDCGFFMRNGSIAVSLTLSGVPGFEFICSTSAPDDSLRSYTLPANFNYKDIIGFGWDDDATNTIYAFTKNGSVLSDTSQSDLTTDISFTNAIGQFTIPQNFNMSDAFGTGVDTTDTNTAIFFKNGSFIVDTNSEAPPFQFDTIRSWTLAASTDLDKNSLIGFGYQESGDACIYFSNGTTNVTSVRDTGQDFTTNIAFAVVRPLDTNSTMNITKNSTNITLQTRVSNSTPPINTWSNLYIYENGSDINPENNIGRYIQYKAVFITPDKYLTPQLENVSINYTFNKDFTFFKNSTTITPYSIQNYSSLNNATINQTTGSVQSFNGSYISNIFDLEANQVWTNISWTTTAQAEIGRIDGDNNGGSLPFINTTGLVLLLHLNNETGENDSLVRDYSPELNIDRINAVRSNGTAYNGAHYNITEKKFGASSMNFDGVNDYVNITTIRLGTQKATFTFWLWWDAFADDDDLAMELGTGNTAGGFVVDPNSGGIGVFETWTPGSPCSNNVRIARPSAQSWHHYSMVIDRSLTTNEFQYVYVDGVNVTLTRVSNCDLTGNFANLDMYLMSRNGNSLFGAGKLDEVSIWNRTLSSAEISQLYKRGALTLNLSVRSCDDSSCAGESFSEKLDTPANNTLNSTITPNNRYFQYHAKFGNSGDFNYTVDFYNATIWYKAVPPPSVTCNCPSSGNWVINDGSVCQLTTTCNIPNNNLNIDNGELHIENGGILQAAKCTINRILGKLTISQSNGKISCKG